MKTEYPYCVRFPICQTKLKSRRENEIAINREGKLLNVSH